MSSPRVPLLLPCHGTRDDGPDAAEVADELAARGLAEVVDDVDLAERAAADGREVLALDGCAASCQARLLDAHGVREFRTLNLSQPAEVEGAASVADLEAAASPLRRSRRRLAPLPEVDDRRSHTLEDYLLAVDTLTAPIVDCGSVVDAPTVSAHIARSLHVSRAAAGEMVARLEDEELIRRAANKDVLLTAKGRAVADGLLRKHRILECFVVETLGYTLADSFDQARQLAEGFGDDAVERVFDALARPARCPHGWPIDAAEARLSVRELHTLGSADEGATVVVDRFEEMSRGRVQALADAGVVPGGRLERVSPHPAAGTVSFTIDGAERSIGTVLADAVLVR
jgi:DtxR family transcriptional regulator, Mn-dependent transcriptional regulator